ncbi:MAG: polysulfide reductase NrfD [Thiomargarita sp.]|nr:polysulfide reductase NrfD [Thiomargarita sp.]
MEDMFYQPQIIWTWWIATYLFLGGLGAAAVIISCASNIYIKEHKELVLWGNLSAFAMLSIGSLVLFIHLLDHIAVIHVLNPLGLLTSPESWIMWGTQFILWMMISSMIYTLPYMQESTFWRKIPIIGMILGKFGWLGRLSLKFHKLIGWLAIITAAGTVLYTGLLLQSFPSVALWNNPSVPLLFTASAFSTALAFLLIVLYVFINREEDHALRTFYERTDVILIAVELLIVFLFFQYTTYGQESARASAAILWDDMGWLVGFIGFGLIVPFLIEFRGVTKGWNNAVPIVLAAIMVLCGGYLLRHYFLLAGVYERPYPAVNIIHHSEAEQVKLDDLTLS